MQKYIEKLCLWTFQVPLFGIFFGPNVMYFPNVFQAYISSVRFTCFVHFSNCCTLKKHCISAVKHVFQQGPHIQHSVGKSKDFTLFQGTIFDDFASIFDRFSVSFFSLMFEAVLAALQAENGSKAGPKTIQNRSKNTSEKSTKKRR